MKQLMKNTVLSLLVKLPIALFELYAYLIGKLNYRLDDAVRDSSAMLVDKKKKAFVHKSMGGTLVNMSLYTPNALCFMRASSFSDKEPETLEWLERFGGSDKVLFDIGANIGIYSIYNCLLNNGKSVAFEPSFFNLKQLTKNINLNQCEHLVSVVTNPLSEYSGFSDFLNGNTDEGGALSAFGVDYGYNGSNIQSDCSTNVLGFSLDNLFELGLLTEDPDFIKVDVDGIEHLILKGAEKTLSSPKCRSVLIEVNDDFDRQANEVNDILLACGFTLEEKRHAAALDNNMDFGRTYNQIWVKKMTMINVN